MATITQLLTSVENLFTTNTWTQHNIKAFPGNYQGKIDADEWVRVNVLPFSSDLAFNQDVSANGQVVCQIFVPSGKGMKRAYEIADILKTLLDRKEISGYLQTTNSFITNVGVDSGDSSLYNVNYTANFRSI
jgi:hypothetical protein